MPRDLQVFVFVGIKNTVLALDDKTGTEIWRTKLRTSDHVIVFWDGEALLAAAGGEVWKLDPAQGHVMWHSELKGLGRGIVSLATTRRASDSSAFAAIAEKRRRDAAAGAIVAT